MVAGMVRRVRSLPIMFLSRLQMLKPLPSGRAAGSRLRPLYTCRHAASSTPAHSRSLVALGAVRQTAARGAEDVLSGPAKRAVRTSDERVPSSSSSSSSSKSSSSFSVTAPAHTRPRPPVRPPAASELASHPTHGKQHRSSLRRPVCLACSVDKHHPLPSGARCPALRHSVRSACGVAARSPSTSSGGLSGGSCVARVLVMRWEPCNRSTYSTCQPRMPHMHTAQRTVCPLLAARSVTAA